MIEFTLFGVPIRIQPWHWIGLAVIGGALGIRDASGLIIVALFMIAGFLAILLHELGHALTGRRLGGGSASIDLIFLGGYTQHYNCKLKGKQRALVIAAGPGCTFLFGVLALFLCFLIFSNSIPENSLSSLAKTISASIALVSTPEYAFLIADDFSMDKSAAMQLYFIGSMLFVSFWWTLFNILPIYPMDGGQFLAEFVKSQKKVHLIGIITAITVGLLSLIFLQSFILTAFMVFFAYGNFKNYQSASF